MSIKFINILAFVFLFQFNSFSQISSTHSDISQKEALKIIQKIWRNYMKNHEGIDSFENKSKMTNCIQTLSVVNRNKSIALLLYVWQYYDPSDYNCRNDIVEVLARNKTKSIKIIKKTIKKLNKWQINPEYDILLKIIEKKK
jgi:hypothetical protein